jgi:hypothetical protein
VKGTDGQEQEAKVAIEKTIPFRPLRATVRVTQMKKGEKKNEEKVEADRIQ